MSHDTFEGRLSSRGPSLRSTIPPGENVQRIKRTISEFLGDRVSPSLAPDASVADAIAAMREHRSSCVLVVQDDTIVGVFTDRDVLTRVLGATRAPSAIPLCEVMTPDPVTLGPDDTIAYAINAMAVGGFRTVPIADQKVIGILTVQDVTGHLAELFAELAEPAGDAALTESWVDIGGQG